MDPDTCCFDEWARRNARRSSRGFDRRLGGAGSPVRQPRPGGVPRALLSELETVGLRGRALLDVGCGVGNLGLDALRRGAAQVSGIDLSEVAIDAARARARELGVTPRSAWHVGNGAEDALEPCDVVVLNQMICCYPDAEQLVANTLAAATRLYAFTVPESTGLRGALNRVILAVGNGIHRLLGHEFRPFVHDVRRIDRQLRAAGLLRVRHRTVHVVWHLAIYERALAA